MPRFALKLALSLAFAIAGTPSVGLAQNAPPTPPVASAQFDYYVMTLSWAPGFCDLGGKDTSSPECADGSGQGFVVHGLWPDNEFRPNPEACRGQDATPSDLDDEHGLYPNDRSNGELVDVRFCLAKDLSSYAVCRKVARHSCQRGSLVVAPVR